MKKMVGKELSGVTIRSVGEPYHVKAMKVHEDAAKEQSAKEKSVMGRDGRQGHDLANDPYSHTDLIRDKVLAAREQCRDFEDFKAILAENGIGTRLNDEGELQFYEGRLGDNGEMLDFVNGMDWPVNAKTLRATGTSAMRPSTGSRRTRPRSRVASTARTPMRPSHRRRT